MKGRTYNILFFVLAILLVLHFLFYPLSIIKDSPLSGSFHVPEKQNFTIPDYLSKRYQDSTEVFLKYNFGLFPGLTRVHNQVEYSFFDKIHVHDVHKGKDGYLHRYVPGYFEGKQFDNYTLNHYLDLLNRFADSLKTSGKIVIWAIAPDKSIVYKETLPSEIAYKEPINLYYESLKNGLRSGKFSYIDFNELAIKEKDKYPFPVCNKGGIHWTQAYSARCYDTLCKFINQLSGTKIEHKINYYMTGTVWGPDYDIENSANLLIPLERDDSCYLAEVAAVKSAKSKKILLVGDSFCHAWMWNKFFEKDFHANSEFWYYNKEASLLDNRVISRNPEKRAIREYISKFDVFVITYSAANANMLDYGFLKDVFGE